GSLENYTLRGSAPVKAAPGVKFNRIAYSAAHVVADPLAPIDPWLQCAVDWDATIAYRQHLWSLGLGVAEAMDTAQRGMGMDWPTSLELIRRSLDAARDVPGALIASGCGTDHLAPEDAKSVDDVIRAYVQGRRHQDLAAGQGQGNRDAPPVAAGRAHVHRRRLQLRRTDRRRRFRHPPHAGPERRPAGHLRRHRSGRERCAGRAGRGQ